MIKIATLLLFVAVNAQDSGNSDDVDDESYSVQMMHREIHNTPIEGKNKLSTPRKLSALTFRIFRGLRGPRLRTNGGGEGRDVESEAYNGRGRSF